MDSVVRYESRGLRIGDLKWSPADARASAMTLSLAPGMLVVLRSGLLLAHGPLGYLIDPNYLLVVTHPMLCVAFGDLGGSCTVFHFEPSALDAAFTIDSTAIRLSTPEVFLRHWHILCWTRSRPERTALIDRAAFDLLGEAAASNRNKPARIAHGHLVGAIKTALAANGAMPLSLDGLAAVLEMSPFTISRIFHREVGLSIRHYSKRLRLRKALQMMLDSDADLSSIALDLGFFDQAHFSNAFRQDFGIPPSLILAAHRRGQSSMMTPRPWAIARS